MKLVFWGSGIRGRACLQAMVESDHSIGMVLTQSAGSAPGPVEELASRLKIPIMIPANPNDKTTEAALYALQPDFFVLASYGKILRSNILAIPKRGSINLHGGKLPEYRGSSPMNWALINGETTFGLSAILLGAGVDTGDVIVERTYPIGENDTIKDLHETANTSFPQILIEALSAVEAGAPLRRQETATARYFPLRFPDDGFVLWDTLDAAQIHNRIRALTEPYPCAVTYHGGREVKLLESRLHDRAFFGEAGRIYQITDRGLLVCARDRCLWLTRAVYTDDGTPLRDGVRRYDRLATVAEAARRAFAGETLA